MDGGAWWAIVQRVAKIWMDMTKHADTSLIMDDTDISPRKFTQARKLACTLHVTLRDIITGPHLPVPLGSLGGDIHPLP